MEIKFNDVAATFKNLGTNYVLEIEEFLKAGNYTVTHEYVNRFENAFADFQKVKYAIGVANGTDAFDLCLDSLVQEDETALVIMQTNNYHSTAFIAEAKRNIALRLVDNDESYQIYLRRVEFLIQEEHNNFNKIILNITNMYGMHLTSLYELNKLKEKYDNLYVIEDCSHSILSLRLDPYYDIIDLSFCSLYPGKILGAAGEAGIIFTDNFDLYKSIEYLSNQGGPRKKNQIYLTRGSNKRIDAIQCIPLYHKLKYLPRWLENRKEVGACYYEALQGTKNYIEIPDTYNVPFYVYPIRLLDKMRNKHLFMDELSKRGIPTKIHYQTPIHYLLDNGQSSEEFPLANKYAGQLISLPAHQYLTGEQLNYICDTIINLQ